MNDSQRSKIVNHLLEDVFDDIKWYERIWYRLSFWGDIKYWFKKKYQRFKYGFPLEETWNLNTYCAEWILPRLKIFRKDITGFPCGLTKKIGLDEEDTEGMNEWREILDKMIWSFENFDKHISPIYSEDYDHRYRVEKSEGYTTYTPLNETGTVDWSPVREHERKVQEGLDLFAKYFINLWD